MTWRLDPHFAALIVPKLIPPEDFEFVAAMIEAKAGSRGISLLAHVAALEDHAREMADWKAEAERARLVHGTALRERLEADRLNARLVAERDEALGALTVLHEAATGLYPVLTREQLDHGRVIAPEYARVAKALFAARHLVSAPRIESAGCCEYGRRPLSKRQALYRPEDGPGSMPYAWRCPSCGAVEPSPSEKGRSAP